LFLVHGYKGGKVDFPHYIITAKALQKKRGGFSTFSNLEKKEKEKNSRLSCYSLICPLGYFVWRGVVEILLFWFY